jgi:nicotinate-nucleotide pyrophosphorylase (carboxylating)
MVQRVFAALDPSLEFQALVEDGINAEKDQTLARISGRARSILTGERTALNFLGRLSGIASLTQSYVSAVEHARASAVIVGTRKTTPGLRALEKYAVVAGGGGPHRYGLYDGVLIKDNHVSIASGVRPAVQRIRASVGPLVPIQVEVDTLEQLEELLPLGVDAVLLDNMDVPTLRTAVEMCRGRLLTEASGGITLDNLGAIASTGVNRISVGALTHSAPSLDVALDVRL